MSDNLTWYPLYWIYNDCWCWQYTQPKDKFNEKDVMYTVEHPGHIHFFMMDFPTTSEGQQAYHGEQTYSFELVNEWGEGSGDVNQQNNIRVVGRPKWYFYIAEYWRRVYIQDWDSKENSGDGVVGKKGLKYEASKDCHSRGPYREGKDNYFFCTSLNRTLPVEYWRNAEKTERDHYLRHGDNVKQPFVWDFGKLKEDGTKDPENLGSYPVQIKNIPGQKKDQFGNEIENPEPNQKDPVAYPWEDYFKDGDDWTIPRNYVCEGNYASKEFPGTVSYSDEDKARWNYPDKYFISPVIEYQKVVHANWERLPGYAEKNDIDTEVDEEGIETGNDFGDGWSIEITSPFKIDDIIQSPFSDDNGNVQPVGIYCHDLDKKGKIKPLKYNKKFYDPNVKNEDMEKENVDKEEVALSMNKCLPTKEQVYDKKGEQKNVTWNFPDGFPKDGKWVEQCLGAMVIAKARVVLEDNFNKRSVQWITTTSFNLGDTFVGKDDGHVDNTNAGKPAITFTEGNLSIDPVTKKKTMVLSETVINKFDIIDNNGNKRLIPQTQLNEDAELDFTGINIKGTWRIEFPK